jgi:hypothetical protein
MRLSTLLETEPDKLNHRQQVLSVQQGLLEYGWSDVELEKTGSKYQLIIRSTEHTNYIKLQAQVDKEGDLWWSAREMPEHELIEPYNVNDYRFVIKELVARLKEWDIDKALHKNFHVIDSERFLPSKNREGYTISYELKSDARCSTNFATIMFIGSQDDPKPYNVEYYWSNTGFIGPSFIGPNDEVTQAKNLDDLIDVCIENMTADE